MSASSASHKGFHNVTSSNPTEVSDSLDKQYEHICGSCLRFQSIIGDLGKCTIQKQDVHKKDQACENYAKEIEVKHSSEGWTFVCGHQNLGPFRYLESADYTELATHFGVHPKEAFKAKMRVYASEYEPRKLETSDVIDLEDRIVKPCFNGLSIKVHPAIGVIDQRAYVCVFLPCIVQEQKKDGQNEVSEQEIPFFITSLREKLLTDKKVLSTMHWRLAYRPTTLENRWSLKSIENFLNGAVVDPAKVYRQIKDAWLNYIEFEEPTYYDLLTLWVVGTYFFHLFNTYPYIYFGGVKRTGKTKALTVASTLAFNAIFSGNVSTSSVFRLIQSGRCSLLMDETEKLSNPERAQDFRSLLLTGYKRGGVVYRTEKTAKEKHVPEAFEVFSPKMLANISGIEDILEDRCITITMKRGKNKPILNREVDINDPIWQELRDDLYILFLTHWEYVLEIHHSFSEVNEFSEYCEHTEYILSGRELELWKPILTLAKFFDKYAPVPSQTAQTSLSSLILELAKRKSLEKRIEDVTETGDYILVETLLTLVKEDRYYKVKEIKDSMANHFDEEQKWLNTQWIGRALKRLGFFDKRRVGTGYEYRLSQEAIKDLAERLGIEAPQGPQRTPKLSIGELESLLRLEFTKGTQEEFQALAKEKGALTDQEAESLFSQLIDQGVLALDSDGFWRWV